MTKLKDLISTSEIETKETDASVLVSKTSEGTIEVNDPNFIEKLHQYRDLQDKLSLMKSIEKEVDNLKEFFKEYANLHDAQNITMFGISVVKITEIEKSTFDSKNFKLHYPEMYKEFSKESSYKTVKVN